VGSRWSHCASVQVQHLALLLACLVFTAATGCSPQRAPEQPGVVSDALNSRGQSVLGLAIDKNELRSFPAGIRDARIELIGNALRDPLGEWYLVGIGQLDVSLIALAIRGEWKSHLDVIMFVAGDGSLREVRLDQQLTLAQKQSLYDSVVVEPMGNSALTVWPNAGPPFRVYYNLRENNIDVHRVEAIERLVVDQGVAIGLLMPPSNVPPESTRGVFVFHPGRAKHFPGRESLPHASLWQQGVSLENAKKVGPYVALEMRDRPIPIVLNASRP
jgi:hypothetical protein